MQIIGLLKARIPVPRQLSGEGNIRKKTINPPPRLVRYSRTKLVKVSGDPPASRRPPAGGAQERGGASRGGQTSNAASVDSIGTERNTSAPEPVSAASTSPVASVSSTAVGPQAVSFASAVPTTSPSIGISLTPSLDVLSISSQFALEPVLQIMNKQKGIVETVNEAVPVSCE